MMRVLIVEDNFINQEFLKMALNGHCDTVVAESGEQALVVFTEALETVPFDIVFMDVMLPGMNGIETVQAMRSLESGRVVQRRDQARVVVMSALEGDQQVTVEDFSGEEVFFMPKPICEADVDRVLKECLP